MDSGAGLPIAARPPRLTWGLRALGIDALWRRGLTGAGVRVGHLDTGVAGEHPALAGRIAAFLELDEQGRAVATSQARDTRSHGTHTAGILCGGTLEGEAIGVAPEARLHSAVVIDGGRNVVRILRGLEWLRGSGVRVVSMALGIPGHNPVFWTMLAALRAEGALIVCPIGNDGTRGPHAPACHPGVLSVGAIDEELKLAGYTGCDVLDGVCRAPEVLAPGTFMRSAHSRFAEAAARSGTSQACAFVAGVACLLFQARPEATPEAVAHALRHGARPIDGEHGRRYRFGLIQPERALELLTGAASGGVEREPVAVDPPFYRDPELLEARRQAGAGARLPCVVVVSSEAPADARRGAAGPVLDRIAARLDEPVHAEYLPAGRIALVEASPRFIEALAGEPEVVVLSAATACNQRPSWGR